MAKRSTTAEMEAAYTAELAKSRDLIRMIADGLVKHNASSTSKNWGHIGDLKSINAKLQDLSDMLHHTGEYAN